MKKVLILMILLSFIKVTTAQTEKLTNQSIIDMIELGFDTNIILSKIHNSTTTFDVSIEALKSLKEKGVSSEIISAMLNATGANESKKAAKTGIFIITDSTETQILPTIFSGSRTNTAAALFSYGIASAKVRSNIQGTKSSNIIKNNNCTFIFYFKPNIENTFGQSNWWFHTSTSPNEFALVEFDINKRLNCREIEVGSVNSWSGTKTGVKERKITMINIEKISDGVFRVKPQEPLTPGEYCFFYKGTVPQGGYNNQAAFDFSIE